ncbi:MAG: hypothetical protein GX924_07185 [Clostridiaceae bacterium]|mgnify:CR=1 FL=1|nr:hypothetical protein [Clostridiaceae bacterium]
MIFVKFETDGTYGFYTPDVHGEEILEDPSYVEISDELYQSILDTQGLKRLTPDLVLEDIPPEPPESYESEEQRAIRLLQLQVAAQTDRQEMTDDLLQELILSVYS